MVVTEQLRRSFDQTAPRRFGVTRTSTARPSQRCTRGRPIAHPAGELADEEVPGVALLVRAKRAHGTAQFRQAAEHALLPEPLGEGLRDRRRSGSAEACRRQKQRRQPGRRIDRVLRLGRKDDELERVRWSRQPRDVAAATATSPPMPVTRKPAARSRRAESSSRVARKTGAPAATRRPPMIPPALPSRRSTSHALDEHSSHGHGHS